MLTSFYHRLRASCSFTHGVLVVLVLCALFFSVERWRTQQEVRDILAYLHTPVAYDGVTQKPITRGDVLRMFVDSAASAIKDATKAPPAQGAGR